MIPSPESSSLVSWGFHENAMDINQRLWKFSVNPSPKPEWIGHILYDHQHLYMDAVKSQNQELYVYS